VCIKIFWGLWKKFQFSDYPSPVCYSWLRADSQNFSVRNSILMWSEDQAWKHYKSRYSQGYSHLPSMSLWWCLGLCFYVSGHSIAIHFRVRIFIWSQWISLFYLHLNLDQANYILGIQALEQLQLKFSRVLSSDTYLNLFWC